MTVKSFLFIIVALFVVSCTNSTQNNTVTPNTSALKDTCCVKDTLGKKTEIAMQSEITCPNCGHKKTEQLPTDVCVIKYTCENCKTELHPKQGDCCVFCTYGTHKCPSMQ
jgi:hypothetical protein